ncbi:uncharacterized protein H6S33_009328 [Morchella sextelata]|uniref:uncharacterized protein n=1 Tax=Morchella sextelata TaxID=1174677 RepID=UPI001D04961F|nr:uncharacterized protein H6S33_009328 [Morchella sextelata]KAH0612948.1 hypothetical protein H6S33_009328 [Morchella sextelata]
MSRHRNRHRSRRYTVHGTSPLLKRFHKPRPSSSSAPIFLRKSYVDRTNETRELIKLVQQSIRILPTSKTKKPRSKISVMLPKIEEGDEEVEIIFDLSDLDLKLGAEKIGQIKQSPPSFEVLNGGGGVEYVDGSGERGEALEMECAREGMDWEHTCSRVGMMFPGFNERIQAHCFDAGRMQGEEGFNYGVPVDGMDWEDEG